MTISRQLKTQLNNSLPHGKGGVNTIYDPNLKGWGEFLTDARRR
jgi:hypothetical protein